MKFHFPSFALGVGVGVAGVLIGSRLRPVIVEVAASAYGLVDAITGRFATLQEDVEDVLAEARERARARARA
jgi:hypothetical protein